MPAPTPSPEHSPQPLQAPAAGATAVRPLWVRVLWLLGGVASLVTGIVGIFLPLLPTTPFVLLAAFCFTRSSTRCERWLLNHPRFGPMVRDWRANHAVPLRAKQLSALTMTIGSVWAAFTLPARVAWLPAAFCLVVSVWLWRLPTRPPTPPGAAGPAGR